MTSWDDDDIFNSPAMVGAAVTAPTTPCDDLCIQFFNETLHSWDCQILNRRDPFTSVLPSHMELEDAVKGTPYEEVE